MLGFWRGVNRARTVFVAALAVAGGQGDRRISQSLVSQSLVRLTGVEAPSASNRLQARSSRTILWPQ